MNRELSTDKVKEKLMRFLLELMNQGVSAREIAEALWDLIGGEVLHGRSPQVECNTSQE